MWLYFINCTSCVCLWPVHFCSCCHYRWVKSLPCPRPTSHPSILCSFLIHILFQQLFLWSCGPSFLPLPKQTFAFFFIFSSSFSFVFFVYLFIFLYLFLISLEEIGCSPLHGNAVSHSYTHCRCLSSHNSALPCALSLRPLPICALPLPSPSLSLSLLVSLSLSHMHTHTYTQPLLWSTGLLLMLHRPLTARCSVQLVKDLQGSRGKAFTLVSSGAEMLLLLLLAADNC